MRNSIEKERFISSGFFTFKHLLLIVHETDFSTIVKETRPIFLDEDEKTYFPDTKSVNNALRGAGKDINE